MTDKPQRSVSTVNRMITALRELIRALDRRVPHVERPGELRIARESQILRGEAVAQIEALSRHGPDDRTYDQELAHGIMTDDGSPSPDLRSTRHPITNAVSVAMTVPRPAAPDCPDCNIR